MTISFLPGDPNRSPEACSFACWNSIETLAYCSGNNLVIVTKNGTHLQTIYLPGDPYAVEINSLNGKIALAIGAEIRIFTPTISNFYNFNFGGRKNLDELGIEWSLELTMHNEQDDSKINCLSWSDTCEISNSDDLGSPEFLSKEFHTQTTCEVVAGSDRSLTLWRMYYAKTAAGTEMRSQLLWHKMQPNAVRMVKFSPNSSCIVSAGFCDRLVKLWYRLSYGIESAEFELYYVPVPSVVTALRWKTYPSFVFDSATASPTPATSVSRATSELDLMRATNGIVKLDLSRLRMGSDGRSVTSVANARRQHNVLYVVSADAVLRVFSTYKLDGGFEVYANGSIDLFEGEKRRPGVQKFVTFIDSNVAEYGMTKLLDSVVEGNDSRSVTSVGGGQSQSMEDLLRAKADICLVFDSDNRCKLYSLVNLDQPAPTKMAVYQLNEKYDNAGRVQSYNLELGNHCMPADCRSIAIHHLLTSRYYNSLELTLVVQDLFKNTIRVVGFSFEEVFQMGALNAQTHRRSSSGTDLEKFRPVRTATIGTLQDKLTGHSKSIRRLIRSTDGSALLSTTRFSENCLWFVLPLGGGRTTLNKKSTILTPSPIITAAIWKGGDYVAALVEGRLIVYDCRFESQYNNEEGATKIAPEMCSLDVDTSVQQEMCFCLLPEVAENTAHLVAVYRDKSCRCWEVGLHSGGNVASITPFPIEPLPHLEGEPLHRAYPIDPVGWQTSIESSDRDVLSTITPKGFVRIFYAEISDGRVTWHLKDSFMTGIEECAFLSGSSVNKLALASKDLHTLSIWNTRLGALDYEEHFESEQIGDIDWTATDYHQAILSVGFSSYTLLYTQMRYDYSNQNPTFAKIKKISIGHQTTHEIGDSIWMKDGLLVTGAGNQFFISDKSLDAQSDVITNQAVGTLEIVSNDLFHLCAALNGPLPFYHPQFIIQALFANHFAAVEIILVQLCKVLREVDLGDRRIDASLDLDNESLLLQGSDDNDNDNGHDFTFTAQTADTIIEKLQRHKLPYLTGHQQATLSYTVGVMRDILLKYYRILDYNALRYYLGVKLFQINMSKGTHLAGTITMRDVTFAMHSDNKDLLYNMINEQASLRLDWLTAKRYGLAYWLNQQKLAEAMEKIAKNEFFKWAEEHDGKKDPSRCAIFYMALKKKQILLALWRTATGHPEQSKMIKFLSHDFEEERWRKAASKNAYVLLSKHRYVDAAYFFLLAGGVKDAVDVIARKLDDVPLAIAVARTYEQSDHGDALKQVLMRHVLPGAIEDNNRWFVSWCFWVFNDRPAAIQSLIKPIEEVIADLHVHIPESQTAQLGTNAHRINTSNNVDPVLLLMFKSLRERNIKYFEGAQGLAPGVEFNFVAETAAMYQTMGCDWLAVSVVRNWTFTEMPEEEQKRKEEPEHVDPSPVPNLLGDFLSPVSSPSEPTEKRQKPPASAFAEPDMSAFDFGF